MSGPDEIYFDVIRAAISVCQSYRPKFGKSSKGGLAFDEFRELYRSDPFYSWFGLDSPLVYAAHRAAGGMTSVYRQIGIACERLFRQILRDSLGISTENVAWSYRVPASGGKTRTLSLDGRIPISAIANVEKARIIREWLDDAASELKVKRKVAAGLDGPVFEVRQGYKSKDSKRQNADISNAGNAYANSYLPCVVLLSAQIDHDVVERYRRAQWLILTGTLEGTALTSTYVFFQEIVGYDLAAFFLRNADRIRSEIERVTEALLR